VNGVDGLDGAVSVAVSPDGRHVYATGANDNAVVVFRRYDLTGRLGWVETQRDGAEGVEGLAGADSVAVSPDGRHVYVAGDAANAVVVFQRAETTGKLSFVEVYRDNVGGVDGLAGAEAVALSPDGRHVYVTGDVEHAVAVFRRDTATGRLSFVEVQRDGLKGVDGLAGAEFVAVSPDGRQVYVAGYEDHALVTFARDETSGALSFVEAQRDGLDGVDGLANAVSVAVSPDGQYVYGTGVADNALAVFERAPETGRLHFVEVERDGVNGVDGLAQVIPVKVSPDGRHVYVAGWADNAVAVFARQEAAGR
jgi:6-phosphogluconolactonase (cycloisomerase 2 family)